MLLSQPACIESTLRIGDWHADNRLMYLAPNDMAARGDTKTQHGNCWRMTSELARTTQITVRLCLLLLRLWSHPAVGPLLSRWACWQ